MQTNLEDGGPTLNVTAPRSFKINVIVDETGALVGGVAGHDFEMSGQIDTNGDGVPEYSGVLLTGEVLEYGFLDANIPYPYPLPTDYFDFRFRCTGGAMAPLYAGQDIYINVTVEHSNFNGTFTQDFTGGAKGWVTPTPSLCNASVGDFVWHDVNGNGIQDGGEVGIAGAAVSLFQPGLDGLAGTGDDVDLGLTSTSDLTGLYGFSNLCAGDYFLRFTPPAGYELTRQDQGVNDLLDSDPEPLSGLTGVFALAAGQADTSRDAGVYLPAQLGDRVWNDLNMDGIQDENEPGFAGVTVKLFECVTDTPVGSMPTDANGIYGFDFLVPGSYYLEFVPPAGYFFSPTNATGAESDSDANALGFTACFELVSGQTDPTRDAGIHVPAAPAIQLKKYTNGQDADDAPGPLVAVGSPVTWTYSVVNSGNVPLVDVVVTDDQGVSVSCPATTLAVGAMMTCTATGTAVAGQYGNIGTVTARPEYGSTEPVTASDPSHYFGALPCIDLVKSTNGHDANDAPGPYLLVGAAVEWTYDVTNCGNVPLFDVAVTDSEGVTVDCGTQTTLAVGGAMTCSAAGTAVAGQYRNVGTAVGTWDQENQKTVEATDPSHYFGEAPRITLEKSTNGQDADSAPGPYVAVGGAVTWTYVVTNTGNVPLSGVTVEDDVLGLICTLNTLAVDDTATCTATGTAAAGQYANLGTASGTSPGGTTVTATDRSHYYGSNAGISIEKYTNGHDADTAPGPYVAVGSTVTWEYVVTNTGDVALTDVAVTDNRLGAICTVGDLPVGGTATCTKTGTALAGQYRNTGTVTGTALDGTEVTATDPSHYFGPVPAIAIVKKTNGEDANSPPGPTVSVGSTVTWTYAVTNTGNVALSSVVVTDDRFTLPATACPKTTLAVGETMVCTATGTAIAGQYMNTGCATAVGPLNLRVEACDPSHYFGVVAAPGTGTPGYWKNHPEAWPVDSITIGGRTYTKAQAIAYMKMPDGDKTFTQFRALVCAKLNVLMGNESSCIASTITAADAWMASYPIASGVKGNSKAWKVGEPLYLMLDAYNNGLLCAPHRN